MKKRIAVLLALIMAAAMCVGCGDKSSGTEGNEKPESENSGKESGAQKEEGDTYRMVMEVITYGFDDPDLQMVQDAVNEITIPEIGVEVQFLTVPIGEMATKLGLMVSGKEQMDLVCAGLLTTPSNLASEGLLMPITEYVNQSEALKSMAEGVLEACEVNGELYAYPGSLSNGAQVTYFYDKDLAERYQIDIPEKLETPEEWEALFEQVKASGMDQYAISLGDGVAAEYEWCGFDALGDEANCSYGVVMDPVNGDTVVNYYGTEEYKEKCLMHREWFEKGYCVPDSISNGYSTMDSMTQGLIFGFVSNGGVSMSDAYFAKTTGKNIASIPMSDLITKSGNIVNFCWGVSTSCERPEKVVEFLELMYTNTDLANILNYGIEGTHYVKNGDSPIISYPEGVDASSCGYGTFVGSYGDASKIYQREPLTEEFMENIPNFMYPNAPASKFVGYTFDSSSVSTEVSAVSAVIGKYAPALECGTVDPEQMIPEFLNALEAAGMNKIIEENQKQLDAWLGK